jgi:4-amino-4-deoxy-L-arabinose transferase-like glycosyltransferase
VLNLIIARLFPVRNIVLLIFLCFMIFYWHLGLLPFYTRGENREGLVIWEMVRTGDWILPPINGDYIPFKPPLFHWIGALAAEITGRVDEFTVRFPSALLATIGVLLTYFAGTRFWNEKAGVVAAIVLATSPEWWNSAVIAQVDMTLAVFITAALVVFYLMYHENQCGIIRCLTLAALLACATLAKGPVGVLVPILVIMVFLALRRDFAFLKKLHLFSGAAVFLLIAGYWYFAAWREGGWAFFQRQILEENIGTARGTSGHYQSYFYLLHVFFFNFSPWSLFIPCIAYFIYRRRRVLPDSPLLFPLVWFMSVLLFFMVSFGKRGVYILPLYPAAALLFGAWWSNLEESETEVRWLTASILYVIATSALLAFIGALFTILGTKGSRLFPLPKQAAAANNFVNSLTHLLPEAWACLIFFGAAPLIIFWFSPQRKWNSVFIGLALLVTAATMFLQTAYYPVFAAERTLKPFMIRVRQTVNPQTPLFFYQLFDGSAIFYTGRHIPLYEQKANAAARPFFLLMREEDWKRLSKTKPLTMIDKSEGGGPTGQHGVVLVKANEEWLGAQPQLSNRTPPADNEINAE